jgi:hypothetical protein
MMSHKRQLTLSLEAVGGKRRMTASIAASKSFSNSESQHSSSSSFSSSMGLVTFDVWGKKKTFIHYTWENKTMPPAAMA